MNVVVTRCWSINRETTAGSNACGITTVAPAIRATRGNRSGAEWLSGATTRWRSAAVTPQAETSSATSAAPWSGSSHPLQTPLGRPEVPLVKCIGRHCQSSVRVPARPSNISARAASSTKLPGSTSNVSSSRSRSVSWWPITTGM